MHKKENNSRVEKKSIVYSSDQNPPHTDFNYQLQLSGNRKEFQTGEEKRYLKKTYRRAKNPHGQRKQEQTKMGLNIHNSRKTTQNKEGEELKTP